MPSKRKENDETRKNSTPIFSFGPPKPAEPAITAQDPPERARTAPAPQAASHKEPSAMSTENEETRKSSTPAFRFHGPKPIEPEITVQNPPEPSTHACSTPAPRDTETKNFHSTSPPNENMLTIAEQLMYPALQQLQELYNAARDAKGEKITVDRSTIAKIGTGFEQALEQIKTAKQSAHDENPILKSLKQIQASVAGLEQKYENIQAITTRLESNHEAIERTVKEAPKTYADIISASATNTKEKEIAKMRARQRQRRDDLRHERAKYEVTLTTKQTTNEIKELINTMPPKEITERCQQAVEKASISGIKLQGINKLAEGIRVRCTTEEQAEQLRTIDWSEAFEGIKTHEPNYGIVINGMPIDELNLDDPKTIRLLEIANDFPRGTISKVTSLRRKDKEPSSKTKHRSIVIYFNNFHIANRCLENGCYINYFFYQPVRFTPQFQVMQCFNCYEYGHRAANCKRKPRCGKCAGKHNTKECDSTTVQCVHCKNTHEAWRHECPAWIAEKHRLEELRDHCPDLFTA
jgi:hypothetical protein